MTDYGRRPAPVLVDTADQTAAKAYGLSGYPYLVFVNEDGTVAGRWSGEMPEANLKAVVEVVNNKPHQLHIRQTSLNMQSRMLKLCLGQLKSNCFKELPRVTEALT